MIKHLLPLLTAILFHQASIAQNMVTNGSFEQYTSCPDNLNQVYKSTGWHTGSSATPDYYNSCSQLAIAGAPSNNLGYQSPSNGEAYGGIITYNLSDDWSEYLLGTIQPLTPGHNYKISLKVSLADSSKFASGNIEAYFYTNYIGVDTSWVASSLGLQPQLNFQNYSPITDKLGWTTLTDTLLADSAYTHIMIGRFVDSSQVETIEVSPLAFFDLAYYYVDEVSIIDLSETGISTLDEISGISLSPNPFNTSSKLTFDNPEKRRFTFCIFNIEGQLVRDLENITTGEILLERNDLNAGCYFYELKNEDGAVSKGKLFVQ